MAQATDALHGDGGAGGHLHAAHRVEHGDTGAEDGRVGHGVDVGGDMHGGGGVKDGKLGVCSGVRWELEGGRWIDGGKGEEFTHSRRSW